MPLYENKNAATISVAKEKNPKELYQHQTEAMNALNVINRKSDFSAIIVLPTGAGKTLTSVYWLLKNAVNKNDKVLWIAHRHMLLDQAAESFVSNGYSDLLTDRLSYKYRIISGIHDKPIYSSFISDLGEIMKKYKIDNDGIDDYVIDIMIADCREKYFKNVILPPCKNMDIEALLKYYAYSGKEPAFTSIEDIDRAKVNLSYIAQDMLDLRLDDFEKKDYLDKLWDDDNTLLKLYYTEFEYFKRQLDKEIYKIVYGVVSGSSPTVRYEPRTLEQMTVQQIRECDPVYGEKLRNDIFSSAQENGVYKCKYCGMTSPHKKDFQIDHIVPMSKGGLSVLDNLQLLCRKCNWVKSDHEDDLPLASRETSDDIMPSVSVNGIRMTVKLGVDEKYFMITPARKERGYMTFQIGSGRYKYYIRNGKLEKLDKKERND